MPTPSGARPAPALLLAGLLATAAALAAQTTPTPQPAADPPLLFVKRHNYLGIHIYDTYYKWRPGGGIYVLENPAAPPAAQKVRALIDATTKVTLGGGVYSDPDLSWDGQRVLFCHKPSQGGSTSIYEIGIDGTGLRRITDPTPTCVDYQGTHSGQHDVTPAYLPDGRIVFTSTRASGLVPCANEGVAILHVMNADGTGIHPISVNNVNEFDPSVLPDGRILFGRWEYIDKTALTQQSLWTVHPDGSNETALFANNLVRPEALLDARPLPGSDHLVVASLTRHNGPPRGSIGIVDPRLGKNNLAAIDNLDRPGHPDHDLGESCDPWPLADGRVLCSGKLPGGKHNVILRLDRQGRRTVIYADPSIDCHSPIPIAPRPRPPALAPATRREATSGQLLVQDIYQGLTGVARGAVRHLRVIEETSRISKSPGGALNQTFLVSAALTFSVKNVLGVVPVEADGSAYFEAPAGRALYLQALDGDGRLIQSMRTFVQAAPGVTRSCVGCHEHKTSTPTTGGPPIAARRAPHRLVAESWGSGYIDYPTMVQPILDRHCVDCHGGAAGIDGGLDLSGGWTRYFNISYENLVSRRETQLVAHWISGIDCMNGTANWSARIFPPRAHGSGAAPLARLLVDGHGDRIPQLSRAERDLLLAWIDTNGIYYGTWDYTEHGSSLAAWETTKAALVAAMEPAGCLRCHGAGGRLRYFEGDWFNLQHPERSRILRAPLARSEHGLGLALCRDRQVDPARQRVRLMRTGGYVHHVLPMSAFEPVPYPAAPGGAVVTSFTDTQDPHYQAMLAIIRAGRRQALATPRIDMPGAVVQPGASRQFVPPPLPDPLPAIAARIDDRGTVQLQWERSTRTVGVRAEVYRGATAGFTPAAANHLLSTTSYRCSDPGAPAGELHYAVVLVAGDRRSAPLRATVRVPAPRPPAAPQALVATPVVGAVELRWSDGGDALARFEVRRAHASSEAFRTLTGPPIASTNFQDRTVRDGGRYRYEVRAVGRGGLRSATAPRVDATVPAAPRGPVFAARFDTDLQAVLLDGDRLPGRLHGAAAVRDNSLDLRRGGHATFPHRPVFDLDRPLTITCRVRADGAVAELPVVVSCGRWQQAGWFLQRYGQGWRWHVAGIDCDGGTPVAGRWIRLVATYDGETARLYQDGRLVAERTGRAHRQRFPGALHVGQYSGGPGPRYRWPGRIADLRIYQRILTGDEIHGLDRVAGQGQNAGRGR